jgi:hypothetical protein
MDYIYLIIDYDANEIEYATEDPVLAQEIVTDLYIDTLYYEFLWGVNYYGLSAANAYAQAKETIDPWFRDYVVIEKVPKSK